MATKLSTTATAESEEYRRRRVTTSIRCRLGISVAVAPMNRGSSNHLKPASRPSSARRREHGSDQRDQRSDQEHEREALDPGGRDQEQDERRDTRHDVRVDDRVEALLVATCDRGPYGFARTDLFFDAFEDDHVRSCDSDHRG